MPLEDFYRAVGTGASAVGRREVLKEDSDALPATNLPTRALRGAEKVLGFLSDVASKNVYLPIAENLAKDDPFLATKLGRLRQKDRPLYLSDITSEFGFLTPEEGEGFFPGFAKGVGRLGLDILGDPLSYLTFGAPTTLGKTAKAISAAKRAGQPIKLGSKVARTAAELRGFEQPSAELIRTFDASLAGKPLAEQISGGQRGLVSLDIPGLVNVPLLPKSVAAPLAKPFSALSRTGLAKRLEKGFRTVFSTRSGDPEFDALATQFKDLAMARAGYKIEEGAALNVKMDNLSRSLGMERKELDRLVTALVEKETAGVAARGVRKILSPLGKVGKETESLVASPEEVAPQVGKVADLTPDEVKDLRSQGFKYVSFNPTTDEIAGFHTTTPKSTLLPSGHDYLPLTTEELEKGVEKTFKGMPRSTTQGAIEDYMPIRFTEDPIAITDFQNIKKQTLNPTENTWLADWTGGVNRDALNRYLESVDRNPEHYEAIQKALKEYGFPDLVPIYVGKVRNPTKTAGERPLTYGSLAPWVAERFTGEGNIVTQYMVPREDIISMTLAMNEGEVFFRTRNIKKAFAGYEKVPTAPLFATVGKGGWLNPNTPTEVLQQALDWVDNYLTGDILGLAKGEKKDLSLRSNIIKFKAWLERTLNDKKIETPEQLQQVIEKDNYVPPGAKSTAGSFEITPAGSIKSVNEIDPEVESIVREISESQQRQLLEEQVSGVKVIPNTADRDYITHAMTPEARDAYSSQLDKLGKAPVGYTQRELSTRLANAARREFNEVKPDVIDDWLTTGIIGPKKVKALKGKYGMEHLDELLENGTITDNQFTEAVHNLGVEEINQMNKEGKLTRMFGDYQGDVFHTDPVYSTSIRGVRGERARTYSEFYEELKNRKIGVPRDDAPEGWLPVKQPELEGYSFEPQVAEHLNGMYKFQSNPQELRSFLRLYDATQDAWKAWTLAIFPAYHTRNFVGNMWNNFLAGVYNPRVYYLAGKVQKGLPVSFTDGLGKEWNSNTLYTTGRDLGVLDRGWVGAEIEKSLQQQLSGGKYLTLSSENKIVRAGFKFGKIIENNARMAHFIDRLMKGDTAAEAALSVKKYLFDYGDLSNIERSVFKRLFPFYTWTRKNVPLQLQHLVTQPAKFGIPFKARSESERGSPHPNLKFLPQWMVENFPNRVRYNKTTKKWEYFILASWLPAADLLKVLQLHETMTTMLTPIPKEVIQQAFNYDFFLKRKIEDIPGQKERFLGLDLPKRVTHGAKVIRLLNEIDKMTAEDRSLSSKLSQAAFGRIYPFDPEDARVFNKMRVDKDMDDIRRALRKEAKKKHPDEVELDRIRALLQEKAREY